MRVVVIQTNLNIYHVSAFKIAEHRAEYYSGVDNFEKGSDEWDAEIEYASGDPYELIDWTENNMNSEDWLPFVIKQEPKLEDFFNLKIATIDI